MLEREALKRPLLALTAVVQVPDDNHGSQANNNNDCRQGQSRPEQDPLETVPLPIGSGH
jgi:hypothetical protein